jgi:hypothetical protein
LVVAVPATLSIEIGSIPPAGSAAMKVLAAGLARSIEDSVSAANPGAAARVLSVGGVPAARRLAAADVDFEVLLPAAAGVTEEEAAGMAGDAFEALGEAVAGDEFGEVLAESMQEAAGELVESGEMEAGEVDGVLESVRVEVSDVVAGEPEVLVVEEEVGGGGRWGRVGGGGGRGGVGAGAARRRRKRRLRRRSRPPPTTTPRTSPSMSTSSTQPPPARPPPSSRRRRRSCSFSWALFTK